MTVESVTVGTREQHRLTMNEVFYLKSILKMLMGERMRWKAGPTLYTEALSDNIDWLEMFIESADVVETGLSAIQRAEEAGYAKGLADGRMEVVS